MAGCGGFYLVLLPTFFLLLPIKRREKEYRCPLIRDANFLLTDANM